MPKANRKLRWILLAAVAVVLAVAGFVAYKMFEGPGHAEFKAGKAAYRAGNYESAFENFLLAAEQGSPDAKKALNELNFGE